MEKQSLYIYKLDAQGNKVKFPNDTMPAKLGEYTYTAQRMAGTPTLTATLNYPTCLDEEWSGEEFVEFRGERYYVGQVPTSSKDNKSIMYKHELQFVSERIVLENVYFFDVVTVGADTYHSNSTTVKFMGDINEFVGRLNASMAKSGIGYSVVIDEGITSESKLVSLDNMYLAEALQSIYTIYDLPYYFVGKVCHIGYTENVISTPLEYRKGLISVKKTNANYKIVNRVTGVGSTDNIPFYYPNDSQDGEIDYITSGFDKSVVKNIDYSTLKSAIPNFLAKTLVWENKPTSEVWGNRGWNVYIGNDEMSASFDVVCRFSGVKGDMLTLTPSLYLAISIPMPRSSEVSLDGVSLSYSNTSYNIQIKETGRIYELKIKWTVEKPDGVGIISIMATDYSKISGLDSRIGWSYTNGDEQNFVKNEKSGIYISDINSMPEGGMISFLKVWYTEPCSALMPSIYRESMGAERFYNALNDTYKIPGTNDYYTFKNLYSKQKVKEIKVDFSDIKPTIEGVINASGQLFGEIADVAFDQNDSDELGTGSGSNVFNGTDEYVHSYFYIKLHVYNGTYGFNLFEQGLEGGTAVINMTTGNCAACEFEIGVTYKDSEPNRAFNPVLVDSNGNLPAGDFEQKVTSQTSQYVERQQNTSANEVWIAVKKDNTSFGVVMPNATNNYRPSIGDKFVITGIKMPKRYVIAAEDRLEEALIKYMSENNDEKFTFSVNFSRVFLADNSHLSDILNENARMYIRYNDKEYLMYVNSYTCKADKNCLYDISVELTDKLSANVSALRSTITEIAGDIIGSSIVSYWNYGDWLAKAVKFFLRKDKPDTANGLITFLKGLQSSYITSEDFSPGTLGSGYMVKVDPKTGKSYIEVDEIYVRLKAIFDSIQIKETTHIGGQQLITAAGMKCSRVEIVDTSIYYADGKRKVYADGKLAYAPQIIRCYFVQDDGEKAVKNDFVPGDLAMYRSFNISEGVYENVSNRYYWYEVTAVGDDYIEFISDRCAQGSDLPQAGDEIVQLGNLTDPSRQNAILLSSVGDNAPCKILYQGIDGYSLDGKAIIEEGFDSITKQAYQKIYGKSYIGAKDESSYVKYDENGMEVKAKLIVKNSNGDDVTLIDGGKIKSELIEVDTVITSDMIAEAIKTEKLNVGDKFVVMEDGTLKAVDGEFSGKITTDEGHIGKFEIYDGRLGSRRKDEFGNEVEVYMSMYDDMIQFTKEDKQAAIGTNLGSNARYVGYFSNTKNDRLPNEGIRFDIRNGNLGLNHAFSGIGIGVLNGMMEGYALNYFTFSGSNYAKEIDLCKGKYIEIDSQSYSNCKVMLPSIYNVRDVIACPSGDFAVRITVVKRAGGTVQLYGRTANIAGYDNDNYPYLRHKDFGNQQVWDMSNGDAIELLLTYSANQYNAYSINVYR